MKPYPSVLSACIFPLLLKYNVFAAPIKAALSVMESAKESTLVLWGIVMLTPLNPSSIKLFIEVSSLSLVTEKGM